MTCIDTLLMRATTSVREPYFLLPVAGGRNQIRERAYCYELYHQFRLLETEQSSFTLSGEVDKAGHPKISAISGTRVVPDLVLHRPGSMDQNLLALEVKPSNGRIDGIRKDFATLRLMKSVMQYERAALLMYGLLSPRRLSHLKSMLKESGTHQLEVWIHEKPGQAAHRIEDLPVNP